MKSFFSNRSTHAEKSFKSLIESNSYELSHGDDLDKLVEEIGNTRYVLLGEASHGTHEYYLWRARLSQKLIEKKGFSFIAVEGDWPDCYALNRFVKGYPDAGNSASSVLRRFNRWPTWMWANWEVAAFAEWLRKHNQNLSADEKTGFYGLDVYSLWESMEAIIQYLEKVDKKVTEDAKRAFRCFEPYSKDEGSSYAHATRLSPFNCENEVVKVLYEIRKNIATYNTDAEAVFSTEQNAFIMVNAEKYYRTMIQGGPASWNLRDRHMMDTLNRLMHFHGKNAKAIIWEHNTHIGDARATDMAADGMFNVGQLAREEHGEKNVFSIGFGSFRGTVIAGRKWGDLMHVIPVPEAKKNSWEELLHQTGDKNRIIFMTDEMKKQLGDYPIGHRAIGVVYNPEYEAYGNYVPSLMPMRYDAFIYLDETQALFPMHIKPDGNQIPETFPFGF